MTVQPLSTRRPRRPLMLSDLRTAKALYTQNVSIKETARQLDRNKDVLYLAIRDLDMPRRRAGQCGVRPDKRRRNAKVVEAILYGDDVHAVMRRWEISLRVLYEILYAHKRRTRMSDEVWRKNFLSKMSGLR